MTEFEHLKKTADLIHLMSNGRLEMRPSVVGHVYIRPQEDSYIGMEITEKYDTASQRLNLTFQAFVRRMATYMDADGLLALHREVQSAYALLMALETQEFHPTQEDMMALREHLMQEQQETQQQNTGPVMG